MRLRRPVPGRLVLATLAFFAANPLLAQTKALDIRNVPNPFDHPVQPPTGREGKTADRSPIDRGQDADRPHNDNQISNKSCRDGLLVWANTRSRIYHYPGSSHYGKTRNGEMMCEREAQAAGMRAALNERRP